MHTVEWRAIADPFSHYEVSSAGQVRNSIKGRMMKQVTNNLGYRKVTLATPDWSHSKHVSVHRLVAAAFVSGDNSLDVNHKDMNKANNDFSNLEWVTHGDNIRHGMANNPTWKQRIVGFGRSRGKPVISTDVDGTETRYESLSSAGRALGHQSKGANVNFSIQSGLPRYGKQWRYA